MACWQWRRECRSPEAGPIETKVIRGLCGCIFTYFLYDPVHGHHVRSGTGITIRPMSN